MRAGWLAGWLAVMGGCGEVRGEGKAAAERERGGAWFAVSRSHSKSACRGFHNMCVQSSVAASITFAYFSVVSSVAPSVAKCQGQAQIGHRHLTCSHVSTQARWRRSHSVRRQKNDCPQENSPRHAHTHTLTLTTAGPPSQAKPPRPAKKRIPTF